MNKYIIVIFTILLLTACNKHEDPAPTPEPTPTLAERTVLVYMSGENNLTKDSSSPGVSYLEDDYKEMLEGSYSLNSNQHLIAFIDSVGTDNKPHIVEIANGVAKNVYQYDSEFYASDPNKFLEVIKWGMNQYPAHEYGLVLWGHATGWSIATDSVATTAAARADTRAYGQDKGWDMTGGTDRWMNITQMAQALEQLPTKLKYIFADCCCMSCVECAYELRNSAEWFIASPAEIPGEGAPYQKIVPKLFSTSSTFYKEICDCYYDYFIDSYVSPEYTQYSDMAYLQGYSVPLSAFCLSKMDDLAVATRLLMSTFMPKYPEQLDLNKLPFYFGYSSTAVMYDTKAVFQKYAPESDYYKWLTTYNQAVPYQLISHQWMTIYSIIYNRFSTFPTNDDVWGCTSMFFPQANYSTHTYRYNDRIKQLQWYNAVDWPAYGW